MTYTARARRWNHGWELHVAEIGVTQSRVLRDAAQQVADLVETVTDAAVSLSDIEVIPELGALGERVIESRRLTAEAERLQREAAVEARSVTRELRSEGLSVSDAAEVLGVSRGRVSQLVSG